MATIGREMMQKAWDFADASKAEGNFLLRIISEHLADVIDATEKSLNGPTNFTLSERIQRHYDRLVEVANMDADSYELPDEDRARLIEAIEDWVTSI